MEPASTEEMQMVKYSKVHILNGVLCWVQGLFCSTINKLRESIVKRVKNVPSNKPFNRCLTLCLKNQRPFQLHYKQIGSTVNGQNV